MSAPDPRNRPDIASINPATGKLLQLFEPYSATEVERRLKLAINCFRDYRKSTFQQRAEWLEKAAAILDADGASLARTITIEMGKPIRAAVEEVQKCAKACRYFAQNATRFLDPETETAKPKAVRSFVRFDPLGPVLAVMPWNFPFWQVFRFAAPALMAGNVGLLKHASNVPLCALAIEEILSRAGFPEGAFQTLLIGSNRVNELIEDSRIAAVTLTGSVGAGSKVAAAAGRQIKKTVLELGGSDPFIVMPSANLDEAVSTAVRARTVNNGQSCIAAKRFIIDESVASEFEQRFVEKMSGLKVGDPLDESTEIGPLATEDVVIDLLQQVDATLQLGAKCLLGGKRLDRAGFYFAPTVLTNIPDGSPARRDEIFGPVASIFRVKGMNEAIRIANDTPFGLGACAWTKDESERDLFISEIEAGLAFVNGMVASDPGLPFGGLKQSGYGRELGYYGIREFVNIKTVVIR